MMAAFRSRRSQAGLSLLEVMIAMVILAIGLLGMLSMQVQALSSTTTGKHVSEAARVAQDQLEMLKYQSWAATAPTAWTPPIQVMALDLLAVPAGQQPQQFNVSWRIQAVPGLTRARQIDVRVTWQEAGDTPSMPPRRYAVSTLKYNGAGTP